MSGDQEPSEFERDVRIDPDALDVACLAQAEQTWKWAQRAIEAKAEADRLDLAVGVCEAKLNAEVRADPAKFDVEKPTVDAVAAVVAAHPRLRKLKEEHIRARAAAALLDKGVSAMDVKKRMLENLIRLHELQYFAGPDAPRNLSSEYARARTTAGAVQAKQRRQVRHRGDED